MLEKMKQMLADQLGCDADTITEDTSFQDDLGADSLDLFEMVLGIEEEYGVEMPTEELTQLKTVGDVLAFFKQKGIEL